MEHKVDPINTSSTFYIGGLGYLAFGVITHRYTLYYVEASDETITQTIL